MPAAYVKLDALEQSLANQRLSAWLSKVRELGLGRRTSTEGASGLRTVSTHDILVTNVVMALGFVAIGVAIATAASMSGTLMTRPAPPSWASC